MHKFYDSGSRFRFSVRSISHRNLYLPLKMKALPEIKALSEGVSPLDVFKCDSLDDARKAFRNLRMRFDFSFWAAAEYSLPDKENPQKVVPLRLNPFQISVVDAIESNSREDRRAFFLISKSTPNCGLSSCLTAYIKWRQRFHFSSGSLVVSPSSFSNLNLSCREKSFGYIHLVDMSKWKDPSGKMSLRIFSSAINALDRNPASLFIMEGDFPSNGCFLLENHQDLSIPQPIRLLSLQGYGANPVFLDLLAQCSLPEGAVIRHIPL